MVTVATETSIEGEVEPNGTISEDTKSGAEVAKPEGPVVPKFRSAPAPIVRPARNFADIEACKRTPAYITNGITLTTATKTHQVGSVESEQSNEPQMPALF